MTRRLPGSSLDRATWDSLDDKSKKTWDSLSDQVKKLILSSRPHPPTTSLTANEHVLDVADDVPVESPDPSDPLPSDTVLEANTSVIDAARSEAHGGDLRRMLGRSNAKRKVKFASIDDGDDYDYDSYDDYDDLLADAWGSSDSHDPSDFHQGD